MSDFICALPQFSAIRIGGADATTFLHGQFTSDVNKLTTGEGQISAWCNPKGRVLCNFLLHSAIDYYLLVLPTDLSEKTLKRLQMFILRADVQLELLTERLTLVGISSQSLPEIDKNLISLPIPDKTSTRFMVIAETDDIKTLSQKLTDADNNLWKQADIEANIPWITEATTEQFLPQELNLDDLGGLNYNKGCYPGQEIIARIHFRGDTKRKLMRLHLKGDCPAAGEKLLQEGKEKTVGTVINAEAIKDNGNTILAVIEKELLSNPSIQLDKYGTATIS